ncbi:unnamed protein product [Microthlaspi erraticum]|uniref:Uncharacterized protein n=1 Tax=Microthlaspi erraticum TaxID=1685480 RepID=A0A6D2KZB2_9BRAS|nr:unnamed protein product [Microthlaspi erraticum]
MINLIVLHVIYVSTRVRCRRLLESGAGKANRRLTADAVPPRIASPKQRSTPDSYWKFLFRTDSAMNRDLNSSRHHKLHLRPPYCLGYSTPKPNQRPFSGRVKRFYSLQ